MTESNIFNDLRVAAVLTIHNRKEKSIACLNKLLKPTTHVENQLRVSCFICADGCTDGSIESISANFPHVNITTGNGQLFWNRGMIQACNSALNSNPDYLLWLNDDVMLYPQWQQILQTSASLGDMNTIIVGSVCDPESRQLSYGALAKSNSWHPFRFRSILPGADGINAITFQGNCVLIPVSIYRALGGLSPSYHHHMGDIDFGLRARKAGFKIQVTNTFIGECKGNDAKGAWTDHRKPLAYRLRALIRPTGLPPVQWFIFSWRHGGWLFPILFFSRYWPLFIRSSRGSY